MRFKKYVSSAIILGTFFSSTTGLSFANEEKNNNQSISDLSKTKSISLTEKSLTDETNLSSKSQSPVIDINENIDLLLKNTNESISPVFFTYLDHFYDPSMDVSGSVLSKEILSSEIIYMGDSILENKTSVDQTMLTDSFSKTLEISSSTQTTHGFAASFGTEGKVGIPLVTEGKVSTTLSYDFSNTNINTTTESVTNISPSQPVNVPAGKTFKCTVSLKKNRVKGSVNLVADVERNLKFGYNLGSSLRDLYIQAETHGVDTCGFSLTPDSDKAIRATGTGTFVTDYATECNVTITDITNPNNPKFVRSFNL